MNTNMKQIEFSIVDELETEPLNNEVSGVEQKTPKSTENSSLLQVKMKWSLSSCKQAFSNRNAFVDLLGILFGIGSWIGVNSTYLQLPLLVAAAPEGWNLPSYLVVIIQLGNIGPLAYTIIQKIFPNRVKDAYMIYGVLVVGTIAALLTSFFYKETATIGGQEKSLALFILVFFFALVGCTSSVLFMPYMGRFRDIYLITYLIGEGMSGFIPSIVTLIQGVGGNAECRPIEGPDGPEFERYNPPPRFATNDFFIFVFLMLVLSTSAFTLLDRLKLCKKEYAAVTIKHGNDYSYDSEKAKDGDKVKTLSKFNYVYLLVLMGVVCMFGNGVFPSIQSYSCLPYGNIAYHLTVTLSSIANPLACFLAVFVPHTSIRWITSLCGVSLIFSAYSLATALTSPSPPLAGTTGGVVLVVLSWTFLVGLISYIKLSITSVFRYQGGKSLVWTGAVQQIGSFVGAVVTFCLINFTTIFSSYDSCADM